VNFSPFLITIGIGDGYALQSPPETRKMPLKVDETAIIYRRNLIRGVCEQKPPIEREIVASSTGQNFPLR
jgi:hypothetical protein